MLPSLFSATTKHADVVPLLKLPSTLIGTCSCASLSLFVFICVRAVLSFHHPLASTVEYVSQLIAARLHTAVPQVPFEEEDDAVFARLLSEVSLRLDVEEGDGNCLFRAVARQVYGSPELHARVRAEVCQAMEADPRLLQVLEQATAPDVYISWMSRNAAEGGIAEVLYAQQCYQCDIVVYSVDDSARCGVEAVVLPLSGLRASRAFPPDVIEAVWLAAGRPATLPVRLAVSVTRRHWDSVLPGPSCLCLCLLVFLY